MDVGRGLARQVQAPVVMAVVVVTMGIAVFVVPVVTAAAAGSGAMTVIVAVVAFLAVTIVMSVARVGVIMRVGKATTGRVAMVVAVVLVAAAIAVAAAFWSLSLAVVFCFASFTAAGILTSALDRRRVIRGGSAAGARGACTARAAAAGCTPICGREGGPGAAAMAAVGEHIAVPWRGPRAERLGGRLARGWGGWVAARRTHLLMEGDKIGSE